MNMNGSSKTDSYRMELISYINNMSGYHPYQCGRRRLETVMDKMDALDPRTDKIDQKFWKWLEFFISICGILPKISLKWAVCAPRTVRAFIMKEEDTFNLRNMVVSNLIHLRPDEEHPRIHDSLIDLKMMIDLPGMTATWIIKYIKFHEGHGWNMKLYLTIVTKYYYEYRVLKAMRYLPINYSYSIHTGMNIKT